MRIWVLKRVLELLLKRKIQYFLATKVKEKDSAEFKMRLKVPIR